MSVTYLLVGYNFGNRFQPATRVVVVRVDKAELPVGTVVKYPGGQYAPGYRYVKVSDGGWYGIESCRYNATLNPGYEVIGELPK